MVLDKRFTVLLFHLTLLVSSNLGAQPIEAPKPEDAANFARCLTGLITAAKDANISAATIDSALRRQSLEPRIVELDRSQPEFTTTFMGYYPKRVNAARTERGRVLLEKHRKLLAQLQQRYGVPGHYLLSFWGLETNFGGYMGDFSIPAALTTLACDPRRSKFFTGELVNALKILDNEEIELDSMVGSWAGAMGNVQFMPSTFLRHAVDGDGDGRRDLWGSIPDALASAANFLNALGWQPNQRWGREVRLPEDFDYQLTGRKNKQSLAQWAALGIRQANGDPLPTLDWPSAVLLPAGRSGPAFIAYGNFDVIMGWNRSEFYALSVGRLADRIAGAGDLIQPLAKGPARFARQDIRSLQQKLNDLGFDSGGVDGILGSGTRSALARFQAARQLPADGYPDAATLKLLGVKS